ncbi:MAG: aldolase/citrate lyase family protein [Anaerolineales bacterium]
MSGLNGKVLKERLQQGQTLIGAWITVTDPTVARMFAQIGFDFLMIDLEHSAIHQESLQQIVLMFEGTDTCPLVRVPWHDLVWVKWALDCGAEGILFPNIRNAEEARRAVRLTKYPPDGERGFFPRVASNFLNQLNEYLDGINERINVWIQIEDLQGIRNLDEIFAVGGFDAVLVGPADLSLSMGILGQWEHPQFKQALEAVLAAGRRYGIPIGYPADDSSAHAVRRLKEGFQLVTAGVDGLFAQRAARETLQTLRAVQ